jgi:purine-binding chemotaxis protein CheW
MEETIQLCAFVVGDEEYAIDIMRIREIIQPQKVTAVRRAPEFIEGVINLRGTIVPIVDLRRRLGLPQVAPTKKTRFIICRVGTRPVGLVADAVTGVLRAPRSQIKPAPGLLGRGSNRYFLGVVGSGERLRLLLNVKAILQSSEPVPPPGERAQAREG